MCESHVAVHVTTPAGSVIVRVWSKYVLQELSELMALLPPEANAYILDEQGDGWFRHDPATYAARYPVFAGH